MKNFTAAEQWVANLYDESSDGIYTLYDLQTAQEDLDTFRQEWDTVPKDLTAEVLMETWNYLACRASEMVTFPNGRTSYRYLQMSDREIAEAIQDAPDWSYVKDLVEYVNDSYLELDKDEDGYFVGDWERAIEEWCDEQ